MNEYMRKANPGKKPCIKNGWMHLMCLEIIWKLSTAAGSRLFSLMRCPGLILRSLIFFQSLNGSGMIGPQQEITLYLSYVDLPPHGWMKKQHQTKGACSTDRLCDYSLNHLIFTELFLLNKGITWSRYEIAECYMIMGGIPYYLNTLSRHYSVTKYRQNILQFQW